MEATSNLSNEIESLKSKLTGNMLEDMEIRDQIHNLEMKKNGVRVLGDGTPKNGAHNKPVIFLHPKDFFGTLSGSWQYKLAKYDTIRLKVGAGKFVSTNLYFTGFLIEQTS